MKCYSVRKLAYLEPAASAIGFNAGILHIRESMNYACDQTANNIILKTQSTHREECVKC